MLGALAGFATHQVAESLVPVAIGRVIDEAIEPGDAGALGRWLALLAALFTVLAFAWLLGARATTRVFSLGAHDLRQLGVRRVLAAQGMRTARAPGEVLEITSSDAARTAGLSWALGGAVGSVAALVTSAVALLVISVPVGLVVLVATPLILVTMHVLARPLERRSAEEQERAARASTQATDFMTGLRVLHGIGAQRTAARRYRATSRSALTASLAATRSQAFFDAISAGLSQLLIVGVVVWAGLLALDGQLRVGELVTVVGLALFVQGPMSALGSLGVVLAQQRASARRVATLLAEDALHDETPDPGPGPAPHGSPATGHDVAGAGATVPALVVRAPLAGPAELTVERGEMIGLAFTDAARARRLVELLAANAPLPDGGLLVHGRDARALGPSALRREMFVAPSDGALFSGSVLENVAGPGATPADLRPDVLEAAAVDEVLEHLPDGVRTRLTEAGRGLSGGQRQRVALARALQQPHPIVVLHDPTTALDSVTEHRIARRLRTPRERTLVLVTTSPALLAECDRVVMCHPDGVSTGTHPELVALAPYRELVTL